MFATLLILLSILLFLAGIGLLITFAILKKKAWIWISSGMVVVAPILLVIGIVTAFTDGEDAAKQSETAAVEVEQESSDDGNTLKAKREEQDKQLKENAIKLSLEEVKGDQIEIGDQVYLEGEVVRGEEDPFTTFYGLSTVEGNEGGFYLITDFSLTEPPKERDKIKVYGTYEGEQQETGFPEVFAKVVEKQ
jgi:hypothetical protein